MSLSRKGRQQLQKEELAGRVSSPDIQQAALPFEKPGKPWWKYLFIGFGVVVTIIVILAVVRESTPGPYDNFAKCLNEKGAVMYGAMGWCKYTQGQKAMFGKSFKYINYKEFTEYPTDQYGEIKKTPTWIINGKAYENTQSFERLEELTECTV